MSSSVTISSPSETVLADGNPKIINNANVLKRVHREVRFGSYILGSTLGEGEFGKVKLGWRKDGKQPSQVAIKLIKRDTIMKDSESEIKIHREINSLKMLNHPNIVNLVEVMKSGKYIGIVLEYASGGELFDYILQHKYLKENVAKKLFAQLVSGVDYMHSKGLIHRDLKLENLLLDKHKNVIISDFGFVNSYNKSKNDLMKTSCGSPCYAAPELVLSQSPYEGRKVDIWSLGVILYAMLAGYLPFDDDPENEDGADIIRLYHYICKTPLTFPEYVSPLARDLLRKIIVPDPRKRSNIDEIRNHPWLSQYANLLSVRQPEWDKLNRERIMKGSTNMQASVNMNKNKRFSMINERTYSSSLMIPIGDKGYYGSNIMQGKYASQLSPTNPGYDERIMPKQGSPTKPLPKESVAFEKGHTKSASLSSSCVSASNVLKAMVIDNDNRRNSLVSLDSATSLHPTRLGLTNGNIYSHPSRAPTFNGAAISTIKERSDSDYRTAETRSADTASRVTPIQTQLKTSTNSFKESSRLPHATRKPRPTSYHPSSMSSSLMSNNTGANTSNNNAVLLDYLRISNPLLPIPLLTSNSPTKVSPIAESFTSLTDAPNSPTLGVASNVPASSRRASVVTHLNVNGVLSNDSHLNSHENKRNSVLSYLEDKIDSFELGDQYSPLKSFRLSVHENPDTITPQINQAPTFDNPDHSPSIHIEPGKNSDKDKDEKANSETPENASEANNGGGAGVTTNTDSISNQNNDSQLISGQLDNGPVSQIAEPESAFHDHGNRDDNGSAGTVQRKGGLIKPEMFDATSQRKEKPVSKEMSGNRDESKKQDGKDAKDLKEKKDGKENRENNDSKEVKETKKRNRFSLLSFYSNYNSSSGNVSQLAPSSSSSANASSSKRILEPSADINLPHLREKNQNRHASSSSSKSSSVSRRTNNSNNVSSHSSGKEASAARKVMDFFKRRSIRTN